MNFSIVHVSYSDIQGGAAKAAYRLHRALLAHHIKSSMLVQRKSSDDFTVIGPKSNLHKFINLVRSQFWRFFIHILTDKPFVFRSFSWYPIFLGKNFLKAANQADIVHLHWLGDFPSIEILGRIERPVVWTLHDMWAFCGTEHYSDEENDARWINGYFKKNNALSKKSLDLDRWAWKRKIKAWSNNPFNIVTPSTWLAKCVKKSALMKNWPVYVIPNAINCDMFKPFRKKWARTILNLSDDAKIILFGADGGVKDPRKGFDLLLKALQIIIRENAYIQCLIFGQGEPEEPIEIGCKIKWMGKIGDEWSMALLYNAADLMIVPSRQENLPQTATEAQACGCPVVAFNTTGLVDVVVHKETGYLARPFDTNDLANGILWLLSDRQRLKKKGENAWRRARRLWSFEAVAPKYIKLYEKILSEHHKL